MTQEANYMYDTLLVLKAAGLIAASAAVATIVDTGGGHFGGDVVIDVSALEIASNDEIYDIVLQGSPDAAFGTAGNIKELAAISLSAKEVKRTDSDLDDDVGRFIVPFRNEAAGVTYRYLRLYTVVAGSIATGINYAAFIGKRKW